MKKALPLLFVFCCLSFQSLWAQAQCPYGRYYDLIFSNDSVSGIPYGSAIRYNGNPTTLKMDIYKPEVDAFPHRPLIIFAFGGSFTSGTRVSPDIVRLATEFAQRGYVVASIDYRLGFEGGNDSDTNQFKALLRGVQDMKAAVRYFYKDANTTNTWHIDTNQIWVGGVSAGAFIALNYAYFKLDTTSRGPIPAWVPGAFTEVGGLEGNSGNPGYSERVKGVIDLSGAIADTVWIKPTDPLVCGVHGDADSLVPCYYDSAKAAGQVEALLYGSGDIITRANNVGLPHSIYIFHGAQHAPFVLPIPYLPSVLAYMDTTIWVIRDFLYQHVCDAPTTRIFEMADNIAVSIVPNSTDNNFDILSLSGKTLKAEVYSIDGKLLTSKSVEPYSRASFFKSELGTGLFLVQLSDKNNPANRKVERVVIY
jgi:hypothetical protein